MRKQTPTYQERTHALIIRLYLYACASLVVGFALPLFLEPLRAVAYLSLNALVATELAPLLGALSSGLIVAVLFTFAWNFLGAIIQIVAGLFGPEITKFILFGRAFLIGFIYGGTTENITRALGHSTLRYAGLAAVVLIEFLAYSIATYGGVNVGRILMPPGDRTLSERILDALKGPSLSTYKKMKNEVKTQLRASLRLCPAIAALLILAALLEIWLLLG
jgi:cytochrome c oxidase subunit IV